IGDDFLTERESRDGAATDESSEEGEKVEDGIPPYGEVRLLYGEVDGVWRAEIGINPLGGGLRALGLTRGVEGGYLTGTGSSTGAWPSESLQLEFEGKSFVLRDVNFFVQLLSLVSVTGAIESLVGQGVSFGSLTAELELTSDTIVVRDFFMSGERLGVSASGRTGLRGEDTEIQGAVVPAYIFNALLARIPLIGTLLSGGEAREGLFAVNYSARGFLGDPDISVNPLSVISPGFVRRLFGGGARAPEESGESEEEEPIPLPQP
ncbi:MAG: AsmA-like C-terminal region-containing protein, partial [Alphaproteobacteria bacterium]